MKKKVTILTATAMLAAPAALEAQQQQSSSR